MEFDESYYKCPITNGMVRRAIGLPCCFMRVLQRDTLAVVGCLTLALGQVFCFAA